MNSSILCPTPILRIVTLLVVECLERSLERRFFQNNEPFVHILSVQGLQNSDTTLLDKLVYGNLKLIRFLINLKYVLRGSSPTKFGRSYDFSKTQPLRICV